MNLQDALRQTADYLHLNAEELEQFAEETPKWESMRYGGMSIDREEGMFLYALVRALKPEHALEIGVFAGVSSMHLRAALVKTDHGDLVSYDKEDRMLGATDGWEVRVGDAAFVDLPPADFVFEDSDHQFSGASAILAKVKALYPRVVVSHDYYSHEVYADNVGFQVKMAFDTVFGADNVLGVRWDGGQRGFGVWLNPEWQAPKTLEQAVETRDEAAYVAASHAHKSPTRKPAPAKRTPKKVAVKR